jgi:hypothetical protein
MWKRLSEANLVANHFTLGGDFNHWEATERGGEVRKHRMHKKEAIAWHHLTLQYNLINTWKLDKFRKMSIKEFTFDNERSDASSTVSHIDKFLVSQDLDLRNEKK